MTTNMIDPTQFRYVSRFAYADGGLIPVNGHQPTQYDNNLWFHVRAAETAGCFGGEFRFNVHPLPDAEFVSERCPADVYPIRWAEYYDDRRKSWHGISANVISRVFADGSHDPVASIGDDFDRDKAARHAQAARERYPDTRMRHEIRITDDEIEVVFERRIAALSKNKQIACIEEVIFTRETIQDFFDARRDWWADAGAVIAHEDDFLRVTDMQSEKGDRHQDVTVIDFGTVRAVLSQ